MKSKDETQNLNEANYNSPKDEYFMVRGFEGEISLLAYEAISDQKIECGSIHEKTQGERRNYIKHKSIIESEFGGQYMNTMDYIFDTYYSLVAPMKDFFYRRKAEGQTEDDVNILVHNTLRCLLPLATLTSVEIFGNGRFFLHVASHLLTMDLPEAHATAERILNVTSEMIPQYVRRASRSEYLVMARREMEKLAQLVFDTEQPERPRTLPNADLLEENISRDVSTLAAMVFPYTNVSASTLRKLVEQMSGQQRQEIINTYIGVRKTRRDRPGRALEDGYPYTFDMVTNLGVYKDLGRHRVNTQMRQLFTAKIGFEIPEELVESGFKNRVEECLERVDKLYDVIAPQSPLLAQYTILHGHYVRWLIGMNDREAMHMLELRTTSQGHSQYRKAAQQMHKLIKERSVWRADIMKFVDHSDYFWSRGDSEAHQRVKEEKVDSPEKYD